MATPIHQALIGRDDFQILIFCAALAERAGDPNAQALLERLRKATVCASNELPEDAVALNTRVLYRLGDDLGVRGTLLVHPHNLLFPASETSVMSPLGSALLGLRAGDRTTFDGRDGAPLRELTVEGVGWRLRIEPAPPASSRGRWWESSHRLH